MNNLAAVPVEDNADAWTIPDLHPNNYYPINMQAHVQKAVSQTKPEEFERQIAALPVGSSILVCTAARHFNFDEELQKCKLDKHVSESLLMQIDENHNDIVVMTMSCKRRVITKLPFPIVEYIVSDTDSLGALGAMVMEPEGGMDGLFNNNYGRCQKDNMAALGDGKYATIKYKGTGGWMDSFHPEEWGNDVTDRVNISYHKSLAEVCSRVLATRLMIKYQLELGEFVRKSLSLLNAHMFYEPDAGEGAAQAAADWKDRVGE